MRQHMLTRLYWPWRLILAHACMIISIVVVYRYIAAPLLRKTMNNDLYFWDAGCTDEARPFVLPLFLDTNHILESTYMQANFAPVRNQAWVSSVPTIQLHSTREISEIRQKSLIWNQKSKIIIRNQKSQSEIRNHSQKSEIKGNQGKSLEITFEITWFP